ncbi:hypothetical protein Taro_035820 [Colocasia esculenta]|uniref:RRM domain-containing protein n=1 Tax=Colocasia esculenta TaxID=4460 RepID=A0A843VZX8_COLES|nr:hypothetical protein [Colocasia esculenta]
MPRGRTKAAATKADEPAKPVETEEEVNLDEENDAEEDSMEEEIEYEEIEEEIEEEVEEEVEEEEEEDAEEQKEEAVVKPSGNDEDMKDDEGEEDECEEHAELLALPPHGSEVYIGNIPLDASEEDLKSFCEAIGEVVEVRVMKGKDSADNRRYAFITYRTKELASKAIKDLNNTELKASMYHLQNAFLLEIFLGKRVKVSASQAKHRLFIGNVPRNWAEDDLKDVVTKVGPGVNLVELKKVKALYVKNLPKNVTQDQLKELFKHHGEITKVVLPPAKSGQENSRFGFVHFAERAMAMKALKNTEKYELDGQVLECSLAKPPAENKKNDSGSNVQKPALIPSYPPRVGYGLVGPYGAVPAAYGVAGFGQPVVYGRGAAPAGIAMMPMLLPDGRLGYVLQQAPTAQQQQLQQQQQQQPQQRGDRKGGNSSRGRQGGDGNKQGQRYRPY